jgi:2-polyprenyl-3-methyl-5-hydroxy-6-metoxy-1,4-benzoquinol methylase
MTHNGPLRILTVADVPPDPNSGAAGTVYHTNVALRELGHHVDEIWADDLRPRRIAHGNLHALLEQPRAYRREVLKAVARKPYDVVLLSQPQAWLAAKALKQSSFQGLVINRSHGVELRVDRILPEWHRRLGVPESRFPLLTRTLRHALQRQWPRAVRWSDGVVVPSEMDRECLLQEIAAPPYKVRTVHHGLTAQFVDTPVISPQSPAERFRRLLYVGQQAFIKGPDVLAAVVNRVLLGQPDVTMTWVTSAWAHETVASKLDASIRDRITLQDWLPHVELPLLYDAHGVFVFPSFVEGAGKAAFEAMSRGLCVVATDTGGMRDYIRTDDPSASRGRLCPVGDVDAFVAGVRECVQDPQSSQSMGRRAQEYAHQKTWHACARRIVEYAQELLRVRESCGRRGAAPAGAASATARTYDAWHAHRSSQEGVRQNGQPKLATWHQMVIPRLGDIGGLRVAEIGCGRGDFSIYLARLGAEVTALDFSAQAIAVAKQRAAQHDVDINWHVGDAMAVPFDEDAFDLVVTCECLEHVLEPQRMARELYRICKPGGRVLLTTPSYCNGQIIGWIHSWVTRRPNNSGSGVQPYENLFFFFLVKRMLRRAGFAVEGTTSRVFQFLLLPHVAPAKLRLEQFKRDCLNRLFRPLGLHFLYELRKPSRIAASRSSGTSRSQQIAVTT